MKEWTRSLIGVMFSIALIVFTGMGLIPVAVFCSVATGAIVWFFKDKEIAMLLKNLKEK